MIWERRPNFNGFSRMLLENLNHWNPPNGISCDVTNIKDKLSDIMLSCSSLLWNPGVQALYNYKVRNDLSENLSLLLLIKSIDKSFDCHFKLDSNLQINFGDNTFDFLANKEYSLTKLETNFSIVKYVSSPEIIGKSYLDVDVNCDLENNIIFDKNLLFLKENLFEIYTWVNQLTKFVFPLKRVSKNLKSTTKLYHPSCVFLTFTERLNQFLELLVHESAHWHFFLDNLETPLTIKTDDLVFSPIRSCPRPVDKVFLGYHAIVYMYMLYEELKIKMPDVDKRYLREEELLKNLIEQTSKVMEEVVPYLTDSGSSLYEKLISEIQ